MFQNVLFISCLLNILVTLSVEGQTILEIKLKSSKNFRMQIFYTDSENTKKWSEKFTAFRKIGRSDEYRNYKILLNTNSKLENLRIDFGETNKNIISIDTIRLENTDSIYVWDHHSVFEEFYFNQEMKVVSISNNGLVIETIGKQEGRNIDPFIHLYRNYNRLVIDPKFVHRITLQIIGDQPNPVNATFWFEGKDHLTISKNYTPNLEKVTYVAYVDSKLKRAAFSLGNVHNSEYKISSLDFQSNSFQRKLVGSEILDYFQFNLYTTVSGKEVLNVKTHIYDGQFGPGFSSTRELISLKREITMLVTKVILLTIASVAFFYINIILFSDNFSFVSLKKRFHNNE